MNNLSFHTSNPSGKLFSGLYRPLVMASSLAASDGQAYETSFHRNFSCNLAAKPMLTHTTNNKTTLKHFILFLESFSTTISKKKRSKILSQREKKIKIQTKRRIAQKYQTNLNDGQSLCDLIRCAVEQFMGITISSLLVYTRATTCTLMKTILPTIRL